MQKLWWIFAVFIICFVQQRTAQNGKYYSHYNIHIRIIFCKFLIKNIFHNSHNRFCDAIGQMIIVNSKRV